MLLTHDREGLVSFLSIGAVLRPVCSAFKANPNSIPLYIPICTDMGIFLGINVEHIWSRWQESLRSVCNSRVGRVG